MVEFPRELVRQAQLGDIRARELLLARAATLARPLILRRPLDAETVDDLLQEVAVRILKTLMALKDESSFGPLVVIVIRRAINEFFRRQRSSAGVRGLVPRDADELHATVYDVAEFDELRLRFVSAVDGLPPELRVIFMLWAYKHSVGEMAGILNICARTVKRRKRDAVLAIARGVWGKDLPPRVFRRLRL